MIKEKIIKLYSVYWSDGLLQDAVQLFQLCNMYFVKISQIIVICKATSDMVGFGYFEGYLFF